MAKSGIWKSVSKNSDSSKALRRTFRYACLATSDITCYALIGSLCTVFMSLSDAV